MRRLRSLGLQEIRQLAIKPALEIESKPLDQETNLRFFPRFLLDSDDFGLNSLITNRELNGLGLYFAHILQFIYSRGT